MPKDHLDRIGGEKSCSTGIWFPVHQGGVGGEGESGKRVHDDGNPEQLNSSGMR